MTTGTCGCCAGVESRTPVHVENRPGLSAVAYRAGTHADFLASMVAALTNANRPELASLTSRDPDDLTIALLDAWAVVGDLLTFHNERLAQESWLRTAVDRRSLQELGRLVGHEMSPGVAAQTHLAFSVEPPPTTPEEAGRDPGVAPPVTPAWVDVPVGLRVQSIPGPGEQPQTFETVEAIAARPAHTAWPAATTLRQTPAKGATATWLAGTALNLSPGDILLLAGADVPGERWDVRVLSEVHPDASNERTEVRWEHALGSIAPPKDPAASPEAFILRHRIPVFGHNAPSWQAMSAEFKDEYTDDTDADDWPDFRLSAASGDTVDLEGSHPGITTGSWVVLTRPNYRELFRVESVVELSRAAFAVSGKITRLTLTGGENYDLFDTPGAPRQCTVWAVAEPVELAEGPDPTDVAGDSIAVDADLSELAPGTSVIVAGRTTAGVEHAEVAAVAATAPLAGTTRWLLELEGDLDEVYDRSSVVVHGNVALATHGETVGEILGSGRGRDAFQRFRLSHVPLTHVQATNTHGSESTLVVRVNDVAWDEVDTQYDGDRDDHTYTTTVDEHGDRIVAFGDGRRGARLPTGTNNVRATYRKGLGVPGNVDAGALAQLLDRPLGLKGVSNPTAASGGVDPEGSDQARAAIPLSVRTLGRAVSLLDYEDFARAFTGVSKAHAAVLSLPQGRTIVTTVAPTPGTGDASERLTTIADALRSHGDPHVQLQVLEHHTDTFRLAMTVTIDPAHDPDTVLAAVRTAVGSAFSFDQRDLVAPVLGSEVLAIVHGVAGVVGVDLDRLHAAGQPAPPDLLAQRLLARQPGASAGLPLAAGLLVADEDPFDWLEVAT